LSGSLASLTAIAIGVWAARMPPRSVATAAPADAADDADPTLETLVAPEPEPIQPPQAERSPALDTVWHGVPSESKVRIALTVTRPDGSPAEVDLEFAQLVMNEKGSALEWTFADGTTGSDGRFQYGLAGRRELFTLRVLAEGAGMRREVQVTPPFPRDLAVRLEPGGTLVVSVFDEAGFPVRGMQVNAHDDVEDTWFSPHGGSNSPSPRVPFSSAEKELTFARHTPWPISQQGSADVVTDDSGIATFGPLRPGNWRVRMEGDRTTDRKLPEVCVRSGETVVLRLGLERMSSMLAVEGLLLDERGAPLPHRTLFIRAGDKRPMSSAASNDWGVFRDWAEGKGRVWVEPRREHPSEQFDPPFWEGPRGTRGVVFRRSAAVEWVDAAVRVAERFTHEPIASAELAYEIPQRVGTYGVSRNLDGGLRAAVPVAEGLQMHISAPGFAKLTFDSTALRQRAGSVLVLELERQGAAKRDKSRAR
jgi:hypothetical protein